MFFKFNDNITNFLKIIVKTAQDNNLRIFFVGGIVRDNILNLPTKDIDLIIEGNAIDFCSLLRNKVKIKSTHKDFYTVKVEYNNICFDIASTRSEKYPYCGCLPAVDKVGTSLLEDVQRRDFTINSLYCEIKLEKNELIYTLIDLLSGIKDIELKNIKSLHNKTYIDDPTRILRGLDFKYRFKFDFSNNDKKLIKSFIKNFKYEDFNNASIDRLNSVLLQVLSNKNSDDIFKEILDLKLYKIFSNKKIKINYEKIKKIISAFNMDNIEKSKFYFSILTNEKIDIKSRKFTSLYKKLKNIPINEQAVYLYYNNKNLNNFLLAQNIKIFINGNILVKIGFSGKKIGITLDKLFEEKLKNKIDLSTKEKELNWIKNNI